MSNYFHDEQVTWQKMHEQWKSQQNKMRLKVNINNTFDWEVPTQASIKYEKNSNFGFIKVNQNISQRRLNKQWRAKNNEHKTNSKPKPTLKYIGGVDISATKPGAYEYDKACAGLMIYEYPSMKLIHEETEIVTLRHPYIAGYLAFREVGHLIKLVNKVKKERPDIIPQVILVDGNGILHYRRVGLATHLAMRVNIPCIGIAKKFLAIDNLNVNYLVPHLNEKLNKIGKFWCIYGFNEELVGYALKTKMNDDIVYVSPGHMIDYETSLKIVMLCLDSERRYKLPMPTEKADFVTRKIIWRYQKDNQNPYQHNNNYNNEYKNNYNNNNRNNNSRNNYNNNNRSRNNNDYNYNNNRTYQSKTVNKNGVKGNNNNKNVNNKNVNKNQSKTVNNNNKNVNNNNNNNRNNVNKYNNNTSISYSQRVNKNVNGNNNNSDRNNNNNNRVYQSKRVYKKVKGDGKKNINNNNVSNVNDQSKSAKRRNRRKKQREKILVK